MSIDEAPPERSDPNAYKSRLQNLLGGREPLEVLAETPSVLARLLSEHPPDVLRRRPFPGKWTPNEIIGHLADAEWVFGFRMRMILCEEQPVLLGMDQEKWVAGQKRNAREPAEQVEEFTALRRQNLAIWRHMTAADFERIGRHSERGPESLGLMLRLAAGHDLSHIDQIQRYLAAIQGP